MRAVITPRYGSPEVLEEREVPRPQVTAGHLLVQVRAAAVTEGDRRLRSADFPSFTAVIGRLMIGLFSPRQAVQGTMFAGRVVAIGEGVTDYAVGDDVFGSVDHGAYAEFIQVDADGPVARMPASIDYVQAANIPYGGVTALRFLKDLAQVKPGERVLILGASGGVGRFAVQLARHLGAEVTAVCSARNAALVTDLGARHVIDYKAVDVTQGTQAYDVVFDIAGAASYGKVRRILAPAGRYLTVYLTLGVLGRMLMTRLFGDRRALFSIALGKKDDMQQLRALVSAGVLRSAVGRQFTLSDIAKAHTAVEQGEAGVVVTLPGDASDAPSTPAGEARAVALAGL